MSKQFVADRLQKSLGVTGVAALKAVDDMMAAIQEDLIENGTFLMARFGTFKVHKTGQRPAMNPRTGEKISVPASYTVRFKPSPVLKNKVVEAKGGTPRPARRTKKAVNGSAPKGKPGRPAKSATAPKAVKSAKAPAAKVKATPAKSAPVKATPRTAAPAKKPVPVKAPAKIATKTVKNKAVDRRTKPAVAPASKKSRSAKKSK
ncbi:HU family DNA-binding protein [Acetobacter persici]|uniref:HU family DNA-binding protein n=1 Tax=Acetobacter persici TaxID=1076596 RepID=UPI00098D1AC7|nr:HU family DNA-binding protein [Acetobacter persici]